jgi:hypothetical protein
MMKTLEPEPVRTTLPADAPSTLGTPGADATRLAEAPEAVRLPYPFNTMKPEDVPEEVWKRAGADRQTTWR